MTNLPRVFYQIICSYGATLYTMERDGLLSGQSETIADGYAALMQADDPVAVLVVNTMTMTVRDVSVAMARRWFAQYDGDPDNLPEFISRHLSQREIDARYEDEARWARERAALASPEAMGRI